MRATFKQEYDNPREFVDECVTGFIDASDSALAQARGQSFGMDGIGSEEASLRARTVWAGMKQARLFCVEPQRWFHAYNASDRYVEEKLCGLEWKPANPTAPAAQEAAEKIMEAYEQYGTHWPFPGQLPFDSIYLAYGDRLLISKSPLAFFTRMRPDAWDQLGRPSARLIGQLLTWQGEEAFVFTAMKLGEPTSRHRGLLDDRTFFQPGTILWSANYMDEEWLQPHSLDPWIVNILVNGINDHKKIIEEYRPTLGHKLERKKASKKARGFLPLPEPFYMCNLRDELLTAPARKPNRFPGRPMEWSHRWDVRGHECVRIERGELPIDDKLRAKLKKRGYRIYEGLTLGGAGDDANRLLKKGIRAPGPREWLAVLSYWRENFVKGPSDKPYIPAARFGV